MRLTCIASIGITMWSAHFACAQSYPVKPVRILTAEAGGGSDYATRIIAAPLGTSLGQQVIVDNRGLLAAEVASKAPPDGYTLLLSGSTLWLLPFMRDRVPYDIAHFTGVSLATRTANVLVVHPSLPVKSVRALVVLAKSRPGELNYGTSGVGSSVHIAAELFKSMTGANIMRVNYKGASRAITDLMAGEVHLMFGVPGSVMQHVKSGRLTALAVTSAEPSPLAPGLPAVAATVPGYESVSYLGIFAPVGTPAPIVARLSQEVARALQRAEVREKLNSTGIETVGSTPDELMVKVKNEMARMGKVLREADIRADR